MRWWRPIRKTGASRSSCIGIVCWKGRSGSPGRSSLTAGAAPRVATRGPSASRRGLRARSRPPSGTRRPTGEPGPATREALQELPSARDPWGVIQTIPGVIVDRVRNCSTPGTSSSPIWHSRRRRPAGARTRPARAPRRPSASCDAPPRKGARGGHRARRGWTRSYATVTSPSRNVSANGSATCVKRWRVPSRQDTTDERPLNGRLAAASRFVAALARRDPNSLRVFHRNGVPIRRWRTAWRTACQVAGVPSSLPPRLPAPPPAP